MKNIPLALQLQLESGTTTLAWCWRITRADGITFGFTDHDRALVFGGTEFESESGLTSSEIRSGADLSVDAQDAAGALRSDRITEADILDGCWDNAEVELWRVNWQAPGQRVLMRRGAIGQMQRLRTTKTNSALFNSREHRRRRIASPMRLITKDFFPSCFTVLPRWEQTQTPPRRAARKRLEMLRNA